jgi:hypothetical protein
MPVGMPPPMQRLTTVLILAPARGACCLFCARRSQSNRLCDRILRTSRARAPKGRAHMQPAPRAAYAKLLAAGWTDALRTLHPDDPMFTFWSYLRNRWPREAGSGWTTSSLARRSCRD